MNEQQLKEVIVTMMKKQPVTRSVLCTLLGMKDAAARAWVAKNIKKDYPVICTTNQRGYFIPTKPEHLELAKAAVRENHRKAASLHEKTNVVDRWIIQTEARMVGEQMTINL